jgi:pyruvate-ferredoxin/flavodoxin oxidoreductase
VCEIGEHGCADALALGDVGWGVLFASNVGESLDLALVARRAAEDSGNPFVVVHEQTQARRHTEPLAPPSRELVDAYVGASRARVRKISDPAHPIHTALSARVFAERVPFALASAMRELEALTGRRHDVVERVPAGDASVALVGLGTTGESLLAEVPRLRAEGHDVAAIKIIALRPFPGPRVVKALSRALSFTVLENVDNPLAQSNPLTAEIKSAFADALTWAPDYPGIGRIPRIASGVARLEIESTDVDAIVHNMLADERGRRSFTLGAGDIAHVEDKSRVREAEASTFSMRGRVHDADAAVACADLCVAVLTSALGLRARASVRPLAKDEGAGYAFDIVAGRERPRGAHAPHAVRVVAVDDVAQITTGNPLLRLARGGIVAVPTRERSADGVWSETPAWVKAIVHDREARLIGFDWKTDISGATSRWMLAAAFSGVALAGASKLEGSGAVPAVAASLVEREVTEALRLTIGNLPAGPEGDAVATAGGALARKSFAAHIEVPRATVERDEEAIRLGRKDARIATS